MIERHSVVRMECDECEKVEMVYQEAGTTVLPEDWIQVNEGAPFYKNYDFCGPDCFVEWHKGPKQERIKRVYEKEHRRSNESKARRAGQEGIRMRKVKQVVFEDGEVQ